MSFYGENCAESFNGNTDQSIKFLVETFNGKCVWVVLLTWASFFMIFHDSFPEKSHFTSDFPNHHLTSACRL